MAQSKSNWYENISAGDRIAIAIERLEIIINNLVELIFLQEGNRIICFSDQLSGQIKKSYAANAFNQFTGTMHQSEISRICTVWDSPGENRNSLPTLVVLLDDDGVQKALHDRFISERRQSRRFVAENNDSDLMDSMHKKADSEDMKVAKKRIQTLRKAIDDVKNMQGNETLKAIRKFRNTHLAHSLAESAANKQNVTAKYGDPKELLDQTIPIVEAIDLGARNSSFDWQSSEEHARRCAEALWCGCAFEILE